MLDEAPIATQLGTTSLSQETVIESLPVEGQLPLWLTGTLIRNGPARFEAGDRSVRHWFDGMAMLHRFTIADGRVSYANRFLRTEAFKATERGKIAYREFATDPCKTMFRRLVTMFVPDITDNALINVARLGDRFMAMSETPLPIVFDPHTLETLGVDERPPGHMPTAHPHFDPGTGEMTNFAVHLGPRSSYRLYQCGMKGHRRTVASIPVRKPAYLHSFAMTKRYLILALGPLVVNPRELAMGGRPFIENYRWEPDRGTEVIAIERESGRVAQRWTIEPLFFFHHINAFEADGEIVMDLCAYRDAGLLHDLRLDHLRSGEGVAAARPRRIRLPLDGGEARSELIADIEIELPRINPLRDGAPYTVAWGTSRRGSGFSDALVKLNPGTGEWAQWDEPGCLPGEPVFVSRPGSAHDDDGLLLSVVLDTAACRSFLLGLDAATLQEVARAQLPHHIPFGVHGQFFDEIPAAAGESTAGGAR